MAQISEGHSGPALERQNIQAVAGEPVLLPIATGPATGYVWRLELPKGVERLEDGPPRKVDPSMRMGGAEGGYLRVRAGAGEHVIIATLCRPWAPDDAVRRVEIHLHVAPAAPR